LLHLPPLSTLFPYTTLFRSVSHRSSPSSEAPPRAAARALDCSGPLRTPVPPGKERGGTGTSPPGMPCGPSLWENLAMQDSELYGDRKSTRLNSSHVAISYAV